MSIIFLVLYLVFCKYRCRNKLPFLPFFSLGKFQKVMYQWLIQGGYLSLLLDQAEARVAVVIFLRPGQIYFQQIKLTSLSRRIASLQKFFLINSFSASSLVGNSTVKSSTIVRHLTTILVQWYGNLNSWKC